MKKVNFKVSTHDNGLRIDQIRFNDDVLLRRFCHMIGACIDADETSITDEERTITLLPDDNDFFEWNPWLSDDAYDRWEDTLS